MERFIENGKIKWLPLTLFGASFLRPILRNYGYFFSEGIVLVADNESIAKRFVSLCVEKMSNCRRVLNWNARSKKPFNYCSAMMVMDQTHKEAEVIRFLSETDFLPIVVVGGVMPEYLRQRMYLFRLHHQDINVMEDDAVGNRINELMRFLIDDVSSICRDLGRLPTTMAWEDYDGPREMWEIYSIMLAIDTVYCRYLRIEKSEREVYEFFIRYKEESLDRIKLIQDYRSGQAVSDIFSTLVWEYIRQDMIVLVDVQNIEGQAWELYSENKVVFYDETFYFVEPVIFRKMCRPLLETISCPELKRQLKENEIIFCDNSSDYTIKKQIITVYGNVERPRMMWIFKEKVCSPDNFFLEDYFDLSGRYVEGEEQYEE